MGVTLYLVIYKTNVTMEGFMDYETLWNFMKIKWARDYKSCVDSTERKFFRDQRFEDAIAICPIEHPNSIIFRAIEHDLNKYGSRY